LDDITPLIPVHDIYKNGVFTAKTKLLVLIALLVRTNFEMSGQKWLVFDVIFYLELVTL
jgi:hypothetical protein